MKAKDIRLAELVDFADFSVNLQGRRLLLHSLEGFTQLRNELIAAAGREPARRALLRFGYFCGQADAAAMARVFHFDTVGEFLLAGPRLLGLLGWAKAGFKTVKLPADGSADGPIELELAWRHPAEQAEPPRPSVTDAANPGAPTGDADTDASATTGDTDRLANDADTYAPAANPGAPTANPAPTASGATADPAPSAAESPDPNPADPADPVGLADQAAGAPSPSADPPGCWMLVGYASGFASFCLGRPIYFREQKCRGRGDRVCLAAGRDRAGWGPEFASLRTWFQVDDIPERVRKFSAQLRRQADAEQRRRLDAEPGEPAQPSDSTGRVEARSRPFRRVLDFAARVAPYNSSILVTGESGVGKEVLARYIHNLSPRRVGPFLAVNCGALPETLLESELFGHKAGAFTGAIENRTGLFEQSAGGTIFLDEIGDITPATQIKLLRVLQEKEVMRVGESQTRKIDVRIIAATNRDLARAVREGKFREDLYYRLGVIELEVPPLRERAEDILPLARLFVRQQAHALAMPQLRLDARTLPCLLNYSWPGNVRELQNAVERAAVLCQEGLILPGDLPPSITRGGGLEPPAEPASRTLAQVEAEHIRRVLDSTNGNRTKAARILGIGQATLWRKLKAMAG